jgi:hypothetical protein
MIRTIGRRYLPEVQPDVIKAEVKAPGAAPKRRALGDITNAFTNGDESKDNAAKKPTSHLAHVPDIQIKVVDTVSDRDYMRRESDDIDARDANNPLLATCYVNEMYNHFGVLEKKYSVSPSYMSNQSNVNERMRAILVDWLVR